MSENILKAERLYATHAQVICDNELEKWPELYTQECRYRLISRVNYERNLPMCVILAESRGALIDRVTAIRNTLVYAPRYVTHLVSNVRIVKQDANLLHTRSQFVVYFTQTDGNPRVQLLGRSFDQIDTSQSEWLFAARDVVFDNELVPGSIVHPI
ncbi:MAG TPA: aromatic-ring-hydroxylating dioxygenase subunit beta [Pusillimonas sp.]|jgi:3-phenylpropionate/cinnamic acid dioxygenase small subunit|uniref:aromatic-ring-hydroxylating dioxygenase subunit beta n=1 Tax=unclassified Pusillimonas TaxID=2640016 RepID=UPI002620BE46|nr:MULTISPECIES: aromatic-ring-hydroxylating dioxygenase subunit beta [unclassified Pusillimonas]HLU19025.1 aromatic-ring-hydroxylating dioxygenase subunit beta [Pusillimonas sp.]